MSVAGTADPGAPAPAAPAPAAPAAPAPVAAPPAPAPAAAAPSGSGAPPAAAVPDASANGGQAADRIVPASYVLVAPEDSYFDTDMLTSIAAEARALELTQDEATKLTQSRAAQAKTLRDRGLAIVKADPEMGGAHFDETTELVKMGRDAIAPPGSPEAKKLVTILDVFGYGNDPDFVRMLRRIGKRVKEDGGAGGRPEGSSTEKTHAERIYGRK